ncbi:MAG: hypothetical protein V9F00_03825 [Nocardioides sp.]
MRPADLRALMVRSALLALLIGLLGGPLVVGAAAPAAAACVTSETVTTTRTSAVHISRDWRLLSLRRLPGRTVAKVRLISTGTATFRAVRVVRFCDGDELRSRLVIQARARAKAKARGISEAKPRVRTARAKAAAQVAARSKADPVVRSRLLSRATASGAGWAETQPSLEPHLIRAEIIRLVNQHRATLGRAPVSDIPGGWILATEWAEHVARTGVLAHDTDPQTSYVRDLISLGCANPVGAYAENAAMGYRGDTETALARNLVNGWLGSSGHRQQIENGLWDWTAVGVALQANGGWVAIQRFSADDCSNLS